MDWKACWELCRPFTLLAPFVGFVAFALAGWSGQESIPFGTAVPNIILGALSAALLNAASNIVNQYFDLDIDRINKPKRPLPSGRVSVSLAMTLCAVCYVVSFTFAYLVGMQFFVIVIFTAFVTYAYSGPPFRTKRHWLWANVTIAIPRGCLLVVAGWTAVRSVWDVEPWIIGAVFGLYILGAASTKDFADMKGDAAGGCITLPIKFGIDLSSKIITPFFIVPFVVLFVATMQGWLQGNQLLLYILSVLLVVWGSYVAYLIARYPHELATEANHVSWKHMYLIMVMGQLGIAGSYLIG